MSYRHLFKFHLLDTVRVTINSARLPAGAIGTVGDAVVRPDAIEPIYRVDLGPYGKRWIAQTLLEKV